ncbi:MAG: hypothetical protein ACI4UE_06330 [Candidatus Scatovivens sp.]
MQNFENQIIKWAIAGFFSYCLLLPEIFLIDQYISKGNYDMLRFYMTIIVFAKMLILASAVTVIIIKNQKHKKRIFYKYK